jgi:hypothetical protein
MIECSKGLLTVVKSAKLQSGLAILAAVLVTGVNVAVADTPPAPAPPGSTLTQRVAQRKAERGTALSAQDQQRLVSTCVGTQAKLRSIETDEVPMLDNRNKTYDTIDAKLWIVIGQLKLAQQDTFQLEKQRLTLVDKSNNFEALAANYKQTLDDSLVINCQADPNGFKAMLDTTRIYHDQLRAQAADSHDYIINTIKPMLKTFVDGLQTKSPDQGGR